jgi:DNA repair exonuclease SbcCD nuclease subunit
LRGADACADGRSPQVTRRVLLATATVCAGCVLLVVFGNHDSPTLSALDMLELYTK